MILERYILRELLIAFLTTSGVLLAIFVAFTLTRLLAEAGSGLLQPAEVRALAGLKTLIALEVLLPVGLYAAVILAIGRLHQDAEFHAMAAAGIAEIRLLRPVLALALPLALLVALLSTEARPRAWSAIYALRNAAEESAEIDRIEPGVFHRFGESGRTIFIDAMSPDRSRLEGVFIHDASEGVLQVITAPAGEFHAYVTPDRHELRLREAEIYRRVEDARSLTGHFGEFRLSIRASGRHPAVFKEKAKSTAELADTGNPSGRAEYQWRHSTPVSTLLLAMLAVPLARVPPRRSRYAALLGAVLAYALYYNLLGLARNAVEQQQSPALWWVPVALALLVALAWAWPGFRARRRRSA